MADYLESLPPAMTDPSKLTGEAAAISTSSAKIRTFAIDAAANLVDLAARVAVLEAHPPPPPAGNPYAIEHLNGSLSLSAFWYFSPIVDTNDPLWARHFAWISDAPSGQGLRITAPACRSPGVLADGTNLGSSSQSGQLVQCESHVTSAQIPLVHCGWLSGDPSTRGGIGLYEEVWFRWWQRWPAGFRPTLGTQNATMEWHYDRGSEHALGKAVSPVIIVEGVGGASSTVGGVAFDTAPSSVSRVLLQYGGGGTSESGIGVRTEILSAAQFQTNHWYDFVAHFVFDPDPAVGQVQLWIDGVQKVDTFRATQYQRPDGTRGYQEDVELGNYRHWASWSSSVDYAEVKWGPTRASVGG